MRYDRDFGPRPGDFAGRGEYGGAYEGPYPRHGFGRRTGEFERGGGYIGGRGYAGPSYDLEHGYAPSRRLDSHAPRGSRLREGPSDFSSPAGRGAYAWGEAEIAEEYGPARYGYGPYYERLRRRRRPDEEIRHEVEETLFFDTWVDADAIAVTVADGVVTLNGTLPSYDELRFAVDDAWDVEGVRGVRSELDVDEGQGHRLGQGARGQEWERHLQGHPGAGEGGTSEGTMHVPGMQPDNARAGAAHSSGKDAPAGRGRARYRAEAERTAGGQGRRSRASAPPDRSEANTPGSMNPGGTQESGSESGPAPA